MTRLFFLFVFAFLATFNAFSKTSFNAEDPLMVSLVSKQNPNCLTPLGSIVVSASGGTPAYTYVWNNGATGTTVTGLSAGDYEVLVTDGDGSTVDLKITLEDDFTPPVADAGVPILAPCSNTITTLNGNGSTGPEFTYLWVASNGGHILSGANTLTSVADQAGSFQLTVSNTTNGCTATDGTTVTGQNTAPAATTTGGVLNCNSSSVTLGAVYTTLHTSFIWNGPAGFISHVVNPVVSAAGNYVFTVTDTLTGCIQKSTAVVSSNFTVPNADAQSGGAITCAQLTAQLLGVSTTPGAVYNWTGPNGFTSAEQNPVANTPGTYVLTVRNPVNGCTATDPITVTSNLTPPQATATVNGTLTCTIPSLQLNGGSNTPGVSFTWSGPNNFMSTQQNPTVTLPGLYSLVVKNPANGCTGTAAVTVIQNIAPPNASAVGGVKTCSAPMVILAGNSTTPGAGFAWTGPNGFTSNLQNPSVSFVGTYTLKVTHPQNGCTATVTAAVSQNNTPPSVSATGNTITCTNPLAQITTTSSPQGLTYIWSGPDNFTSTQKNPQVGIAGYYAVTATNPANGCINTSSVYINANNNPPFAYAGEDKSLNCYFTSILINASFSSNGPSYSYLWTTFDGNIVSGATSLYPSVNLEGTYTLKVTNIQNGCIDLDSMVVTQSTPVTAVISQTSPVYCSGGANGTATVAAGGGSDSYSYHWSSGQLTPNITGLSAGEYTVTVIDSEGCSATATATVNQLVLTATVNVTHQTIPGVNNGTAAVIGGGGTAPYTAKWSTGAMSLSINGLAPGPYTVTLTDAHGCTLVTTTNINAANCVMTGSIAGVNVTCAGSNNGTATLNLNSALNPIVYAWSNGSSTKTITGLASGAYSVTATDAASCQVVQMVQISAPQALAITVSAQTNVHCPDSADGSLAVGVTGGTKPYSYAWSNNNTNATISNLSAGTYTLTVTDAHNCTGTISAQISSPNPITISILFKTDVTCPGANTGAISVSTQGGLPPYNYFWSNGSTSSSISALMPGNYSLTVTDANDCPKSLSAQILAQDQAPPLLVLKNATVDLDNNGFVSISAALFDNGSTDECGISSWTVTPSSFNCNQTGPQTVTITASDPGGHISSGTAVVTVVDNIVPTLVCPTNINTGACNSFIQFNLPQVSDNCQFNPAQLVQVSGLPSGVIFPTGSTHQSFQYTDPAGNFGQCSFEVFVGPQATLTTATVPASCSGACDGAVTLTQISGGNLTIAWSNGQTGPNLTGLCPGAYTASITDQFSCVQTKMVEITVVDIQAPSLNCPANISASYCSGPVNYNQPLVTDNCTVNPANLQLISGLPSGSMFPVGNTPVIYSYTDGGGNSGQCSFNVSISGPSTQSTVIQSPLCANQCNGSATLTVIGGNGPFQIQWSNGQSGPTAGNLCAGNYTYSVSDFAGCLQTGAITVTQPPALVLNVGQVVNDHGGTGSGSIQINVSGGTPTYTFSWTRNGQFFAATEDLSNLFQGQYIGVISDANGCTINSGNITVSNTVGTKAAEWAQSFSVSPNPAVETARINFGVPVDQAGELRIRDINGRVVSTQQFEAGVQQINFEVSDLPAGLWLLQLSLEDGRSMMRKLVVEK